MTLVGCLLCRCFLTASSANAACFMLSSVMPTGKISLARTLPLAVKGLAVKGYP